MCVHVKQKWLWACAIWVWVWTRLTAAGLVVYYGRVAMKTAGAD